MFICSRCKKKITKGPRFECPKCKDDFCWNCSSKSAGRCLRCGVALSPFRPPQHEPIFEFVPTSD